jgi:flagella basal body P-ring formation protein FlgA
MIRLLLTIVLVVASPFAVATSTPIPELVRTWVQQQAHAEMPAAPARIEVVVQAIDQRLASAPCARPEVFLPSGSRLWGRTRVGVRCPDAGAWSVVLPVTVRIYGPALVATRPLPAQQPIAADDLREAQVEWTREAQGVVTDAAQLDNRIAIRPIATGLPIPMAALRAPQVVVQGDPVKIVGQGRGFAVTADAVALSAALDGQAVRVRTESGRILTGTARAGRVVEVAF